MTRPILALAAALLCVAAPVAASAQTANSSPTSGTGAGGGNVTRTAPAGGTVAPDAGRSQVGETTPVERNEEQKSRKDVTICKGC